MSQNRYPAYTTYEPGPAYFMNAPPRSFDGRVGPPPSTAKQMEPGMQAILNGERHPMSRPFDAYTHPGYEGSFHGTPSTDPGLQALLSGHRPYASARDPSVTYSNPIANFYHDADGPWNSVRATNQARDSTALTVPVPNLDYNSYRDAPASEISDSGYASQAAASQSVVNTEPADYNRELPVQANSFSFTATANSPPSYDLPSFQTRNADGADLRSASQPTRSQKQLQCPSCGNIAKCRSDFKKHQLKHTKPYTCDQPDCTRKEGFATTNDLDRHKKSVHNIPSLTKSFRCVADRCKNKDKIWPRLDNFKQHVKRMHNGQNLDDLIQRSICFGNLAAADPSPSRTRSVSPMGNALAGIDSKTGNPDVANHKDAPDLVISQGRDDDGSNGLAPDMKSSSSHEHSRPRQLEQANFQQYEGDSARPLQISGDQQPIQSSQSDAPGLRQLAAAATAASQATSQADSRNGRKAAGSDVQLSKHASAVEDGQKRLYSKFSNIIASSIANSAPNESLDKAVLRALLELDQNKHIIATTNHRKGSASKEAKISRNAARSPPNFRGPDGIETTMSTAEVKAALATPSKSFAKRHNVVPNGKTGKPQGIQCPYCCKIHARKCDQRKHLRRHTRPFGCTFFKCYQKFGSKDDWKRHETGQHTQMVTWRCEQPLRDGISTLPSPPPLAGDGSTTTSSNIHPKICGYVFYHEDAFSDHLRSQHTLPDDQISTELCIRRMGANLQSRYWCGFCERVLELKDRGQKAWDERFNHIDHHFTKEERDIRDWLDVEAKTRKGSLEKEATRRGFANGEGDVQNHKESGEGGSLDMLRETANIADADVLILTVPKGKDGVGGDGGSTAVAGRKRSHEGMEGSSSDDDSRARVRVHAHGDEMMRRSRSKSKKEETLFFCCRCKQGPYAWSLYQSCLDCEHEFCATCDCRRHESSEEENVDYNPWNHINAGSSQA